MKHSVAAAEFTRDSDRAHWHDQALWFVRVKRDRAADAVPEWEELRSLASGIKQHTLSRLDEYLQQFEAAAAARGAVVHWARDAAEHNEIVTGLLRERGVQRVVKSKSMLTEECGLNHHLEAAGFEVTDTDLGEWIVQLRHEPPSHIVLPAIHIKREEVGELFHEKIGTPAGESDPPKLAEAARQTLRDRFLAADAGITGVNFAVAETGGLVVCTNEGNADLGTSLPPLHIACMGIEKIIPRAADLSVFIRLLARSATGQPITTYTSHFHGPRPGGELHIVLVDNGRTKLLAEEGRRNALRCIRCGACMNTCPVYRRSGGHSYGVTVPGPIGSVLAPARDGATYASLPHACSLCGSCTEVCPVQIDLHHQLLALRHDAGVRSKLSVDKRLGMKLGSWLFQRPRLFAWAGRWGRRMLRFAPRWMIYNPLNIWGRRRELPLPPAKSFREQYAERRRNADREAPR